MVTASSGAYLDHAATSPLLPEALAAMLPFLTDQFANPSGTYRAARAARRAIDEAREAVAALAGCEPDEVVFTSGGTEADNLAIGGAHGARPGVVVVSAVEHDAVLRPAETLGATVVGVDHDGRIDLASLEAAIGAETRIVSVIAVQSETGVVSPLAEVASIVRNVAPRALLHTDAVQAAQFFDLASLTGGFDLVSLSSHKIGGPKGIGALVVRSAARPRLVPVLHGGGQERDLRAGTENVAGIVGFGAASQVARPDPIRAASLRDRLEAGVLAAVPDAEVTAAGAPRSPGTAHLAFPGVAAEEILVLLDEAGVAASAGSACASGALDPSHVLIAMGWSEAQARQAVRFTLGPSTTPDEIELAIGAITDAVDRLTADGSP